MGKASRWLINFLVGKKEDKGQRKNQRSISLEDKGNVMSTPYATPSATPIKRRWSFGKLVSKERAHNKSSRSLDSMTATPLVKRAVLEQDNRHGNTKVLALAITHGTRRTKATYAASFIIKAVEYAAATKIQAAFRSFLARRALHALRGLVKLQALVRGHLVRKQTAATLRRLHALMSIQVRARFQRIRMAEEPRLAVKSQSSRYGLFPQETGFNRAQREAVDINLYDKHGIVKGRNSFLNHSHVERIEQGITRYYSGELSISKREHYEKFSFTTHNSPRHSHPMSKPTPGRVSFSSHDYPYRPNYMTNTQSSKAKVRSQSEPKQRPAALNFKAKGKRTISADEEMNGNYYIQHSSSVQSKGVADENQELWLAKLYPPKENWGDVSGQTSYSEYRESLVTNEPHATLF